VKEYSNTKFLPCEIQGEHSGKNQAKVVLDVISDFEIETNLGYFVGDNASSNDTLCMSLSQGKLIYIYIWISY
jgi:hypothetical protein